MLAMPLRRCVQRALLHEHEREGTVDGSVLEELGGIAPSGSPAQ